jgi:hypothetical protein
MKGPFKITSTMTNGFVLTTMEIATATLDVADFTYGMLVGMFERNIGKHGIDKGSLDAMKEVRKKLANEGNGP